MPSVNKPLVKEKDCLEALTALDESLGQSDLDNFRYPNLKRGKTSQIGKILQQVELTLLNSAYKGELWQTAHEKCFRLRVVARDLEGDISEVKSAVNDSLVSLGQMCRAYYYRPTECSAVLTRRFIEDILPGISSTGKDDPLASHCKTQLIEYFDTIWADEALESWKDNAPSDFESWSKGLIQS